MDVGEYERFKTDDGRQLTFWKEGRGPVLVCHPGGPGLASAAEFFDFCGLADHLTLIKFNPRGVGGSDRPKDKNSYALRDYANDLEELRRYLNLERLSLFGNSHGGRVAITYSATFGDRIDRLVLCAARVGHFDSDEEERVKAITARSRESWFPAAWRAYQSLSEDKWETEEDLGQLVIQAMPLAFGHFGQAQAATLEAAREAFAHPNGDLRRYKGDPELRDLTNELGRIRAPTLVFQGTADPLVSPRNAEEIAQRVSDARLILLDGVGHAFPWVDGRQRIRDEILSFFSLH